VGVTRDAALERPPLPYRRRLRRAAYHGLARAVLAAVRLLPAPAGRRLCRGFARAALAWRPRERDVARANLRLVFPDLAPPAREALLRRAADALTDEEFSMLQRLSVSLDPKIAGLRLTHGIGEHNFTDDGSASTVVPRDLVEELLKYKPVALEILEVIAQANPGPFLRGRSGSSSSSSSGSTPEPETTKAGTSPTTQSGMMASGATSR